MRSGRISSQPLVRLATRLALALETVIRQNEQTHLPDSLRGSSRTPRLATADKRVGSKYKDTKPSTRRAGEQSRGPGVRLSGPGGRFRCPNGANKLKRTTIPKIVPRGVKLKF